MAHTRRFGALSALALTLVLGACSTPDDLAAPVIERSSDALITDADLDDAALEVAATEVEVEGVEAGSVPDGAEVDSSAEVQFSSQAVLPGATGYIAYIRVLNGTTKTWQLWLSNQSTDSSTLVYQGNRTITSTTVNLAGNTLFFTAQVTAGSSNYDVYRLTLSNNAVTRLTTTTSSEADVSVSGDGQTVVWGGVNPSGGKRAIFLRAYTSSTAFTQRTLGISSGNQYEPTVSGDGAYIAFIRQTTSTQVMRFRKSDSTYLTVSTPSTSVYVRAPSVSNGGSKVAWGENAKQGSSSTVKVKTLSSGSTATVVSLSGLIQQPLLTSDGAYVTYAAFYNNAINVFTKNLSNGQTARLTSDGAPTVNTGMFWQKDSSVSSVTVRGTVGGDNGYPVRAKLFQASTGALVREAPVDGSGSYSFSNLPAARYYVTAYEDSSYDGVQDSSELAGAFGRPAIPQQLDTVSGTYTANITLTTPTEIESNDDISTDNLLLQSTSLNGYLSMETSYDPDTGEESYSSEYDYFKLPIPTTGTYTLTTSGSCSYLDENNAYTPDTYLELYSSAGDLLASDDDGSDGYCSLLTHDFTQTGTYFIRVRALGAREGEYALTFQR